MKSTRASRSRATEHWYLGALVSAAVSLSFLRKPTRPVAPLHNPAPLFVGVLLMLVVGLLVDDLSIATPREFNPWALSERLTLLPAVLLAAWWIAWLSRRHRLFLPLSCVGLLALCPSLALWPWLSLQMPEDSQAWWAIPAAYFGLMAVQAVRWVAVDSGWLRRTLAALLVAGAGMGTYLMLPGSPWFWELDWESDAELDNPLPFSYSAESVWNAQPALIEAQLSALVAQDPELIDLYAIGMAGDGSESVFHNEVRFFERLVSQRLSKPGHVVSLINHPLTADSYPLASMSNLRTALGGLATRMDVEQDVLFLFVTSHGSSEHDLLLGLDPLPLDQMQPSNLRQALDDSGIRWRVLLISACYSGGYLEPLRSPETLIITAARHDRSSFGCGAQSEITWFGQAFLVEALNQTIDFSAAFKMARQQIRLREKENDETPSYPQLSMGEAIAEQLERWQAQQQPGPPVPFEPPDLFAERLRRLGGGNGEGAAPSPQPNSP